MILMPEDMEILEEIWRPAEPENDTDDNPEKPRYIFS
jgi:hypothetical protein